MKTLALASIACLLPAAVLAQDVTVSDAYARSANPQSGAAFMTIANGGAADCTLIGASGDAAERIELHTHREVDGVMKMERDEDGFTIPAGGTHALSRGGDHVMLLGLTAPLADGDAVPLTLDFGPCGTVAVEVPMDNARTDPAPASGQEAMSHGDHAAPAD